MFYIRIQGLSILRFLTHRYSPIPSRMRDIFCKDNTSTVNKWQGGYFQVK